MMSIVLHVKCNINNKYQRQDSISSFKSPVISSTHFFHQTTLLLFLVQKIEKKETRFSLSLCFFLLLSLLLFLLVSRDSHLTRSLLQSAKALFVLPSFFLRFSLSLSLSLSDSGAASRAVFTPSCTCLSHSVSRPHHEPTSSSSKTLRTKIIGWFSFLCFGCQPEDPGWRGYLHSWWVHYEVYNFDCVIVPAKQRKDRLVLQKTDISVAARIERDEREGCLYVALLKPFHRVSWVSVSLRFDAASSSCACHTKYEMRSTHWRRTWCKKNVLLFKEQKRIEAAFILGGWFRFLSRNQSCLYIFAKVSITKSFRRWLSCLSLNSKYPDFVSVSEYTALCNDLLMSLSLYTHLFHSICHLTFGQRF